MIRKLLLLVPLLVLFALPVAAQHVYEVACPTGYWPMTYGEVLNASTGLWRAFACTNSTGRVWYLPTGMTTGVFLNSPVLDGVTYTTLATCYAGIPATGGMCIVPPNYTETMAASFTMNKPNSGFLFLGPANITMGTCQIIVAAATQGTFFQAPIIMGGANHTLGVRFTYTGTSNAFQVGTNVLTTREFSFNNIAINITGAAPATALRMTNAVYFEINNPGITGVSAVGTFGIVCDGTGNFCGTGRIVNPIISLIETGILGTVGMNATTIIGGTIQSSMATGIGLDIATGDSNFVFGLDTESNNIGIRLGAGATNNSIDFRSEATTTDVVAIALSTQNTVRTRKLTGTAIVKTDAGTNNHISLAIDGDFDNIYASGTIWSTFITGAQFVALTPTTNQKYMELANTGSTGFYYGIESSAAGGFFTGSRAYESVLYSPSNKLFINVPEIRSKRYSTSGAVALGAGSFTIGAGWGVGATITNISGSDASFKFDITTGAAPGAYPQTDLTYLDGTWTVAPLIICGLSNWTGALWHAPFFNGTATVASIGIDGTPIAGEVYTFSCTVTGKTN